MVVTFDKDGISGHPNHIAVHKGVAKVFDDPKYPIDVMTLTTVGIIRKYMGYADINLNGYEELHYIALSPYHSYRSMMLHHS